MDDFSWPVLNPALARTKTALEKRGFLANVGEDPKLARVERPLPMATYIPPKEVD